MWIAFLAVAGLALAFLCLGRKSRRFARCPLVTAVVRSATFCPVYLEDGRVRDRDRSSVDVRLEFVYEGRRIEAQLDPKDSRRLRPRRGDFLLMRYDPQSGEIRPESRVQAARQNGRIAGIVLVSSLVMAGAGLFFQLWDHPAAAWINRLSAARQDLVWRMADPLVIGAMGAFFLGYGLLRLRARHSFFARLESGKLEELESICVEYVRAYEGDDPVYYPVLEYLHWGRPVRWQSPKGSAARQYQIGQAVPLYRDRETGACTLRPAGGDLAVSVLLVALGGGILLSMLFGWIMPLLSEIMGNIW